MIIRTRRTTIVVSLGDWRGMPISVWGRWYRRLPPMRWLPSLTVEWYPRAATKTLSATRYIRVMYI